MKISPTRLVLTALAMSLIFMAGCDSGSKNTGAHQSSSSDPASIEGSVIVQDDPVNPDMADSDNSGDRNPADISSVDPDADTAETASPGTGNSGDVAISDSETGSEEGDLKTARSEAAQDADSSESEETPAVSVSIAEKAGVLANQREQTLDTSEIGSSLRDPEPLAEDPDFLSINFNQLASFKYDIPDEFMLIEDGQPEPENKPVIPDKIRKLSGRKVAVTGFMLPLKVENGLVTELLLMRDQSMCCFGTVPEINEWISVKTSTDGFKPINDQAVTFFGQLKVDEIRENGYLVGIYEMDGLRMVGPGDLKEW